MKKQFALHRAHRERLPRTKRSSAPACGTRPWFIAPVLLLLLWQPVSSRAQLALADVQQVFAQAVTRASHVLTNGVVAVTDREGNVLGVWSVSGSTNVSPSLVANAISKAGTAAFLSSRQNAFTSRTAGFIVQQHFPPAVNNKAPGPLVGVNFSNLEFSDINKFKGPGTVITFGSAPGGSIVPVPGTSLAGGPGGLPLYKAGELVGGVGVSAKAAELPQTNQTYDVTEDVALAGQTGFQPTNAILAPLVHIDGISVPYAASTTILTNVIPFGSLPGVALPPYTIQGAPLPFAYPPLNLGGLLGELRQPIINDPLPGSIDGQPRLTAAEVTNILALAAQRTRTTRAGIRLPRGRAAQVFITVVNNPDADGVAPTVLGTFRTPDATIFSWDVAVQKARTAVFFSNTNRAYSTRTVGFLAQSLYPPGIGGTAPGLFFGLQERFSMFQGTNLLNGAVVTNTPTLNPNLPNGITIFPGGFPLYRNGVLVGAIGVSGDGVDQDDIIAASGSTGFLAPEPSRADRTSYRGIRLPYAKFPRNPAL